MAAKKGSSTKDSSWNLPERPNEAPNLTNQGDEHPNTGGVCSVTVDGVSHHHGSDDLVTRRADTSANQWGNVPRVSSIVQLYQEDHETDDAERISKVTQPQAELGLGVATQFSAFHVHPQVRHTSTNLLANDGADNDGDHLQTILLRVEAEQLGEELRDLDRDHDARPQEFHCVGDCGENDAWVRDVCEGLDEIVKGEGGRVDAAEGHVLLLEGGLLGLRGVFDDGGGLGLGGLAGADVSGFGTEEEVEDELEPIDLELGVGGQYTEPGKFLWIAGDETYNGQDVVDPSVSNPQCDETENERRDRNTKGNHNRPNTHIPRPLVLEERLHHHTGANRSSRTDEKGGNGTAKTHRRVRATVGAANVADQTANQGHDEDGTPTVALRERPPEKRRATKDGDDQGGEIAGCLDLNVQILGDIHKGGHDCRGGKSPHHGVEGNEEKVRDFLFWFQVLVSLHQIFEPHHPVDGKLSHLFLRPVVWVGIGHVGDWVQVKCAMAGEQILAMLVRE